MCTGAKTWQVDAVASATYVDAWESILKDGCLTDRWHEVVDPKASVVHVTQG